MNRQPTQDGRQKILRPGQQEKQQCLEQLEKRFQTKQEMYQIPEEYRCPMQVELCQFQERKCRIQGGKLFQNQEEMKRQIHGEVCQVQEEKKCQPKQVEYQNQNRHQSKGRLKNNFPRNQQQWQKEESKDQQGKLYQRQIQTELQPLKQEICSECVWPGKLQLQQRHNGYLSMPTNCETNTLIQTWPCNQGTTLSSQLDSRSCWPMLNQSAPFQPYYNVKQPTPWILSHSESQSTPLSLNPSNSRKNLHAANINKVKSKTMTNELKDLEKRLLAKELENQEILNDLRKLKQLMSTNPLLANVNELSTDYRNQKSTDSAKWTPNFEKTVSSLRRELDIQSVKQLPVLFIKRLLKKPKQRKV